MGVFVTVAFAQELRHKLMHGQSEEYRELAWELEHEAALCMRQEPLSITRYPAPSRSGDKHDYYSEGKYEWPDPANPDGPYITRDGLAYPGRFIAHRAALENTNYRILCLAYAGYYLNQPACLDKAAELMRVWFLDADTMMNPHLNFAQAVHGKCDGRGIGIIDAKTFIKTIHAMNLIALTGAHADTLARVKAWFGEYLTWLTTSKNGIDEKNEPTNHMSWWTVQVMACAIDAGNTSLLDESVALYKTRVLGQINAQGGFVNELARKRAYFYNLFNLEAATWLCEMAHLRGIDLWHAQDAEGRCIENGVRFVMPYVDNPFTWPYPQIVGDKVHDEISLQLGALRFGIPECEGINAKRRAFYRRFKDDSVLGSMAFLPKLES